MIIITGMHRSGTSLVANLLHEMGADFGDKAMLLEPDQWNAKGYFENKDVFVLNDNLLLGDYAPSRKFWTTPRNERGLLLRMTMAFARMGFTLFQGRGDFAVRAERKETQIKMLASKYDDIIVKDPRFSLLIGYWAKLVKIDKVLYCYRHPFEVVMSLKKRSYIPPWLGYRQWHFHVAEFF